MRKQVFCKWMAIALAGCMVLQANVFAADPDNDVQIVSEAAPVIEEASVDETAEEIVEKSDEDVYDMNEGELVAAPADEVEYEGVPDDTYIDEVDEAPWISEDVLSVSDAVEISDVPVPVQSEDLVSQAAAEELVGAIPTMKVDTTYSFSLSKGSSGPNYEFYAFTPTVTAVYRVDVTGTKGKTDNGAFFDNNGDLQFLNIHGLFTNNDAKYTVQMEKGTTYYVYVGPDTNRAESGKIKIRQVKKKISSVYFEYYTNKILTVGPKGKGKWALKDDGTKNFDVWLFSIDELKSILSQVTVKYTDGTSTVWKQSDGYEVGSTGLLMIPEQVTDGWKLDQKAYMNVYCGDRVTSNKIEIKYNDPLFKDVRDPSNPYYTAIYWAAGKGITKGYSDGTFGINKSCTRGEAVMFIWRMAGQPAPKSASKSPFKDVPTSHTFYKAILWASQKGITTGYSDKTFRPKDTCTRGQIMTFIWRYKGKPAPKTVSKSPFKDVPKTHTYYKAILWGSQKGVTKGFDDGTFGINKNCSRGQIVTFLYRIR